MSERRTENNHPPTKTQTQKNSDEKHVTIHTGFGALVWLTGSVVLLPVTLLWHSLKTIMLIAGGRR